jgi:hypothetical protein
MFTGVGARTGEPPGCAEAGARGGGGEAAAEGGGSWKSQRARPGGGALRRDLDHRRRCASTPNP